MAGCGIFDIQAHRGKGVTCSFFSSYLLSDSPSLSVCSKAYILSFGSSYRMVKIYISVVGFSHSCCVEFSMLSSYRSIVMCTYIYIHSFMNFMDEWFKLSGWVSEWVKVKEGGREREQRNETSKQI